MSLDSPAVQLAVMKELQANDREQARQIEELRESIRAHQDILGRHDKHILQLDTFMRELRDTLATKDDIAGLRADLRERLDRDELLTERLDHYKTRLVEVEEERAEKQTQHETRFNRRMSWAMVALFIGELVVGYLGLRHG